MLGVANYFVKKGHLSTPCHYQFCLGVLGGMPATVENLLYLTQHIPAGSTWSAFGVGKGHLPSCSRPWLWAATSAWVWRTT